MFLIYLVVLRNVLYRALESVSLVIHLFCVIAAIAFSKFPPYFPFPKIRKLSQTHSLSKEKKPTEDIPAIDDNNCVACFSFILSCSLHRNECLALPRSSPFYLLLCHFFRLFFIMCTFGIFFPYPALALSFRQFGLSIEQTSDNFLRRSFPFSMN